VTAARTTGQAEGEHVAVLALHPLVSFLIAYM
jgi:hypothetical protein